MKRLETGPSLSMVCVTNTSQVRFWKISSNAPTLVGSGNAPSPAVQEQTEGRIQGLVQSNDDLATALERLWESYNQLLAGKPVKNVDEVWAQGKAALRNAARAKNVS
jgi:hypothetical protein